MFLAGQPIEDPNEDVLSRKKLAAGIAQAIAGYNEVSGLVVALYGTWGTGKTSLLNMIIRSLPAEPDTGKPVITVVRFNPWNYSDQNQLLGQFFDTLSQALSRPDLAAYYDALRELLHRLKQMAKPLTFVPGLDKFIDTASKALDVVAKGLGEAAEAARDLTSIKDEISRLLVDSRTRLLVVIDDIDRLTSTEIRQVFQLVKSVADFKNVTYLLAFDRDVVMSSLSAVQEGTGKSYLEKIINVPIEVPPIRQVQLHQLLVQRINEAIANDLRDYEWNNRRLATGLAMLSRAFTTIRQIDRFANVLAFSTGLVKHEVDYTDFTLLTALQILSPEMYYYIRNNPSIFIDTPESIMLARDDEDAKENQNLILRAIAEKPVSTFRQEQAKEFLELLFPKVGWESGERRASQREVAWRRERRICADLQTFETYFQLEVPDEDVPRADLENLLNRLDEKTLKAALLNAIGAGKGIAFLERLLDYSDDARMLSHANVVVKVLMNEGDRFPPDIRGFPVHLDGPTLIMQLIFRLLKQMDSEEDRYKCLRQAIDGATDSIRMPAKIVSVEDQAHNKYGLGGTSDPSRQSVSSGHLSQLERVTLAKIKQWAKSKKLGDIDELAYVLFRWQNWNGKAAVETFILRELSDAQLVKFLGYFVGHPAVADPDNPDAVDWKTLSALVPREKLKERAARIATKGADPAWTRIVGAIAAEGIAANTG